MSSYQNAIKYFTELIDAAELETKDIDNSKKLLRKPLILRVRRISHVNRLGIKEPIQAFLSFMVIKVTLVLIEVSKNHISQT